MRAIVPDEQRGIRPQSPCARRVPAARGRLRRCRSSEVGRSRSSRRLESAPAARGTRPLPLPGRAPSVVGSALDPLHELVLSVSMSSFNPISA